MTGIFWSFISVLAVASFIAIRSLTCEEKLYNKRELEQKTRITDLGQELNSKRKEIEKLNKDLSSSVEMYSGIKSQYDELEHEIEKLQQEVANKDSALKAKQSECEQLKEK